MSPRIAVLVPCRNEALTIHRVITDFKTSLPGATIYVYDNGSQDETATIARAAGALVRREEAPGKGGVVRRMFAEVEADVYMIVDGDATYDASRAPELVAMLVDNELDMVTAVREHDDSGVYRPGHETGNRAFNRIAGMLFGVRPGDMLSGYRALSRRFVKSFPAQSQRFEVETEMTVHALELNVPRGELATRYTARREGSSSKLHTWRDGLRITRLLLRLFRDVKPFVFFALIAAVLGVAGLALGGSVFVEFLRTRQVPRLPTAVLATGLMLLASLSFACGLILDSVARGRLEAKRLAYLSLGGARNSR
ncbi:MAG TPA: glycosyltransferase family 2 protein [Casimicrobiaceae bacterium]|nr:glycosyltransferase family 2 protein [Casimicrobiaceae bacterium]